MRTAFIAALSFSLLLPLGADTKRPQRKSLLDRDPDIVHLAEHVKQPIELRVTKEATVFSDKNGRNRLGVLLADQTVVLESMTERAYKVRGQGKVHGIAGWVAPHVFSSKDPDFVENLKKLHARQIEVEALIAENRVAVGMTTDEVTRARGAPSKTTVKQTREGSSGRWEYVEYEEVKHYQHLRDPISGRVFRQLSHVTREEKSKTAVDFQNDVVTALEESEEHRGSPVKIIVPPVICRW